MINRVLKSYDRILARSPLLVNTTTGFVIAFTGDFLSQNYFEHNNQKFNIPRALEMGCIRAVVITPFVQWWYPFLAYLSPKTTVIGVAKRICIDQCFGSPLVIALVFTVKSIINGDYKDIKRKIDDRFWDTWISGVRFWPVIQFVNFGFVPLRHQLLVAHVASVYWNAVLSYNVNFSGNQISSEARHESKTILGTPEMDR